MANFIIVTQRVSNNKAIVNIDDISNIREYHGYSIIFLKNNEQAIECKDKIESISSMLSKYLI